MSEFTAGQFSPPEDIRARFSPAAERNWAPIWETLHDALPANGTLLELASGSGQHLARFARLAPALRFQPSDASPEALASIEAWRSAADAKNLAAPLLLDLLDPCWVKAAAAAGPFQGAMAFNLIHISPWEVSESLFSGLAELLPEGAPLFLYGPYRIAGEPFAPSNEAFDRSLRERDPRWGVRELEALEVAAGQRFTLEARAALPANNQLLRWRRCGYKV